MDSLLTNVILSSCGRYDARDLYFLSDGGNLSFGNPANLEKGAHENEYLLRGRILEKKSI